MTPSTDSELIERLLRVDKPGYYRHRGANTFTSNATYINPDGPEAAARLSSLLAEQERMREALEPFARFARDSVECEDACAPYWAGPRLENDRICDWFGPSDFAAAATALTQKGPPDG